MTKSNVIQGPDPFFNRYREEDTGWNRFVALHSRSNSEGVLPYYSERFFEVVKIIAAIAILIIATVLVGKTCRWAGNHIYKWLQPLLSSSISKIPLSR